MVVAVAMDRSDRCNSCGTSDWEWEEDPFAYRPMLMVCRGCQQREAFSKSDTPSPLGATVRLVPKDRADRMELEAERRKVEGGGRPTRR